MAGKLLHVVEKHNIPKEKLLTGAAKTAQGMIMTAVKLSKFPVGQDVSFSIRIEMRLKEQ